MAIMYPKNIAQYAPTESEQIVYYELKRQLPDSFEIFYSVSWTLKKNGKKEKSEADFVVVSPNYGFLCLEVKGGNGIRVEDNQWTILDNIYGERKLNRSPYEQAEASMYFFMNAYANEYSIDYQGIYGAGVIFPFYAVNDKEKLSNRPEVCTIDSTGLNELFDRIKKLFKFWGGSSYGFRIYEKNQHKTFLEIIRKRIAIDAAAGALVKHKERQLDVINRVQDGYIYFLSNIRQFYVRGGAGTGKTWIAMKMAEIEAENSTEKVMFLCASSHLAAMVRGRLSDKIDVFDLTTLIRKISSNPDGYHAPKYEGIVDSLKEDIDKYDAIFIDEAQDFSEDLAFLTKSMLKDEHESRLGVFYDDVQVVRDDSFGGAFMISTPPFLLHENIRNTSNIYRWAMDNTDLGTDVIVNPVEGPWPISENMNDAKHLVHRLENMFKKFLGDENLQCSSMVILVENADAFIQSFNGAIAKWKIVKDYLDGVDEVKVSSVEDFKGLEADMIVYVHSKSTTDNMNYIAYTRARYYLIELIMK
ncbi:MAG: DUF2075 domain-containing protein [Lachnospiraceae bacterium]|nr:DUF2075 domain-containing protein [Lachnospiraceae bacterium]